ncbi:MAG: MFS transporter [Mariniblastus sp.]|nr:MFS transporter [Mariniblastus sp.]
MTKSGARGFYFLNVTQFLGAFNDNILKQLLIYGLAMGGIWAGTLGQGGQAWASICLAIPFVLFSGFAGQFSDKYSKHRVSIMAKWTEIPIALIAFYGLWTQSLTLTMSALFIIALQSTFFSPAKFGILPELVPVKLLSRANGTINMFTWSAIILGCLAGGPIYEYYSGKYGGEPVLWLPGIALLIVGVLGTIASHGISAVPAQNPKLKISYWMVDGYFQSWCKFRGTTAMTALFAYAFFYMIIVGVGAMIVADYTELLNISTTWTSVLFGILVIFMGVGDYIAGLASKGRIRHEMLTFGNVGVVVAFTALGFVPANYYLVALLLGLGGFMCGFVMVPLQTMIQYLAGDEQRGQFIGFWNCVTFSGVIIGNLCFYGIRNLGVRPEHLWILCALLTVVFQLLYFFRWRRPFAEAVKGVKVDSH